MKLTSTHGHALSLSILRYEYPEIESENYQANWLVVQIQVQHPGGSWSGSHPSLLTYEVAELADWFDAIASGKDDPENQRFIEPNLHFQYDRIRGMLRVRLDHEYRPPWAPDINDEEVWMHFPVGSVDLRAAAKSLRGQLEQYPQRADR